MRIINLTEIVLDFIRDQFQNLSIETIYPFKVIKIFMFPILNPSIKLFFNQKKLPIFLLTLIVLGIMKKFD